MSQARWTVVFAADAADDLALIEAHLVETYCSLGEAFHESSRHAQVRVEAIVSTAERLSIAPYRGESHDDLLPGLRHLALERAIYWFRVIPELREVQVLAIFFGSQDHQRHMLVRLLQNPE